MESQLFWMLLTFLLGLLLGHRMSLGRDRRKEFNDLSRETYTRLCNQIQSRSTNKIPIDTATLSHYFWSINRYRFTKAARKYTETKHDPGKYNPITDVITTNERSTNELVENARTVSRFLAPR